MVSSAPEGLETSWLSIPTAYAVGFILVPLCGGCSLLDRSLRDPALLDRSLRDRWLRDRSLRDRSLA